MLHGEEMFFGYLAKACGLFAFAALLCYVFWRSLGRRN